MKGFDKLCVTAFLVVVCIFGICNICLLSYEKNEEGKRYRVEAGRIENQIRQNGYENLDLSKCEGITAVYRQEGENEDFFKTEQDYLIREIDGRLYRMEYVSSNDKSDWNRIFMVNGMLGVMTVLVIGVLLYVRRNIIRPFDRIKDVPYELSKGNLTVPIKESKSRFFGKFAWGVDLLRETMEEQKQHELDLQREKKTLILSISHDIKTPLSAIKLYASALSKGLYTEKEKQLEVAGNINVKADEIEKYVSEIIKASNEDFLHLDVAEGEFYLSKAIEKIRIYYKEKLEMVKTEFIVGDYADCILKGDAERFVEVLQNIMENAIKYGDGHCITIAFSEEEDCRLITIKNSGCTLPDTELPHIFDSFWRGSNVGSNGGSGLGLYICRQLMHKMDGEIFAEISDGNMCVTVVGRKN